MEAIKKKLTTLRIEVDEANAREQQAREDVVKANEEAERVRLRNACSCVASCEAMQSQPIRLVVEYVFNTISCVLSVSRRKGWCAEKTGYFARWSRKERGSGWLTAQGGRREGQYFGRNWAVSGHIAALWWCNDYIIALVTYNVKLVWGGHGKWWKWCNFLHPLTGGSGCSKIFCC